MQTDPDTRFPHRRGSDCPTPSSPRAPPEATRPPSPRSCGGTTSCSFRTARSILKSDEETEDALQEAYLQAWRAIGQLSRRRQALDLAGADRHQPGPRPPAPAQRRRGHTARNRHGIHRSRHAPGVRGRSRPRPRAHGDAHRGAPPDRVAHRPPARRVPRRLHAARGRGDERRGSRRRARDARGDGAHALLPRPQPAARRALARRRRGPRRRLRVRRRALRPDRRRRAGPARKRAGSRPAEAGLVARPARSLFGVLLSGRCGPTCRWPWSAGSCPCRPSQAPRTRRSGG